ncbi:MAG: hypothetical protein EOM69_03320 [Clostridia bacterium]|nr:hypothetical protein [Clostridia bacterium]
MKKFAALLLCAVLCVSTAFAAGLRAETLPAYGLSISLPDDWALFTPDTPDDDPNLSMLEADGATVRETLKSSSIVLHCLRQDRTAELSVVAFTDKRVKQTFSYLACDDKQLDNQGKKIIGYDLDSGVNYEAYTIYRTPQIAFLRFTGSVKAEDKLVSEFVQYATVVNGNAFNITLRCDADLLDSDAEALVKQVVDSMQFDELLEKPVNVTDILVLVGFAVVFIGLVVSLVITVVKFKKKQKAQSLLDSSSEQE